MNTLDETIPAWPLVVAAYGAVWLLVIGFVLWLFARLHRLESRATMASNEALEA